MEGGAYRASGVKENRSRRGDAAAIATAASAIDVAAALCAQAIAIREYCQVVCGSSRVERQIESTHFTCQNFHNSSTSGQYCGSMKPWQYLELRVTQLQAMHQGRWGIHAQKVITQRLETVGTKWIAGVRTNFSLKTTLTMLEGLISASLLTSRRCFGRRFSELFKPEGEAQRLAWSGLKGVGSNFVKTNQVENCVEEIGLD